MYLRLQKNRPWYSKAERLRTSKPPPLLFHMHYDVQINDSLLLPDVTLRGEKFKNRETFRMKMLAISNMKEVK